MSPFLFSQLFRCSAQPANDALFFVAPRRVAGRFVVSQIERNASTQRNGCFAQPLNAAQIGDAPTQINALYAMAILSSRPEETVALREFPIPRIAFTTPENVRRSMTLNSMRMSLELFQNGSLRVLELVENRLAENQRDVVHDLCVYLMRHLLDIRARQREARFLRAESVAAFLGLDEKAVQPLFLARRLSALAITRKLESGQAGTIRRALDVQSLLNSQIALLRPQLRVFAAEEEQLFSLLDAVVARLRQDENA